MKNCQPKFDTASLHVKNTPKWGGVWGCKIDLGEQFFLQQKVVVNNSCNNKMHTMHSYSLDIYMYMQVGR